MQLRFGPNRAGPYGLLQPIADLFKLIRKEAFFPASAHEPPYILAPVISMLHRARGLRVIPWGRAGRSTATTSPAGRERADLADPDLRPRLARHLRLHRRRLGLRLEVRDARLDAHLRAARLLRGLARAQRARRRADGPVAQPHRHRREAADDALVLHPAVRRAVRLPDRRHRRDLPRAVRPARGRHRARRRLPHRVLGHALGPLPDGRVHQPDVALGARRDALLRRLPLPVGALARPLRPALVRAEARSSSSRSSSGSARRSRACATTS